MNARGKELTFTPRPGVVVLNLRLHGLEIGQAPLLLEDARLLRAELDVAIDAAYRQAVAAAVACPIKL